MRRTVLFTSLIICLAACHSSNTAIKEVITNSDSVAINYFKGDGTVDSVVAVKIIRDKNDINKLAEYIAANSANVNIQCGYDGSLHFFKQDSVVKDIYFRMNNEHCMLFSFLQDGKLTATVLSAGAKQYLESVMKK